MTTKKSPINNMQLFKNRIFLQKKNCKCLQFLQTNIAVVKNSYEVFQCCLNEIIFGPHIVPNMRFNIIGGILRKYFLIILQTTVNTTILKQAKIQDYSNFKRNAVQYLPVGGRYAFVVLCLFWLFCAYVAQKKPSIF